MIKYDNPNMTVGELKAKFAVQANCELSTLRLIRSGVQLTDPAQFLSDLRFTY